MWNMNRDPNTFRKGDFRLGLRGGIGDHSALLSPGLNLGSHLRTALYLPTLAFHRAPVPPMTAKAKAKVQSKPHFTASSPLRRNP
jgi:hypothetical protein